jgi:hypothetical protein
MSAVPRAVSPLLEEWRGVIPALVRYTAHAARCDVHRSRPCTCGLARLLVQAKQLEADDERRRAADRRTQRAHAIGHKQLLRDEHELDDRIQAARQSGDAYTADVLAAFVTLRKVLR